MREIPVWLLGVGGVGAALTRMLYDEGVNRRHLARAGVALRPVLLADSQGYLAGPAGLAPAVAERALEIKAAGGTLLDLPGAKPADVPLHAVEALRGWGLLAGSIGADMTATAHTAPALLAALEAGASVALANKKPLSGSQAWFEALTSGGRCRYEATVGAGLPVIGTLLALLDSGDRVTRIQGCLSGTLGFLCSAVNHGEPFSAALRAAMAAGYTEPDPRDDLGGIDVARKALILCRLCGQSYELSDVRVQPLLPAGWEKLGREEFLHRLPECDAEMAERVRQANGRGAKVAFVAEIPAKGAPVVGLQEVDAGGPLGRLNGTDNMVIFSTERYCDTPLVVQGPGAGRAVTAAGVLSDMLALAREEMPHG